MQIKLDVIDETLAIKWELFLLLRQENRWFTTKELQTSLNISRSLVLKNWINVNKVDSKIANIMWMYEKNSAPFRPV